MRLLGLLLLWTPVLLAEPPTGLPPLGPPPAPLPPPPALPSAPALLETPAAPVRIVPVEPADPPAPQVVVRVRVPACSAPGVDLKYFIKVENCSPAEAHHVLVRNVLPRNTKFVKADPEPTIKDVGKDKELQWQIGTLGGRAYRIICLVLRPTDAEDVKNCVRVQYELGQCVCTRQVAREMFPPGVLPPPIKDKEKEPEPKKKEEKKKEPPKITTKAKLQLSLDGPRKQYSNLPGRYFVTVTNTGTEPARNLLVTFTPAAKATFAKASDDGKFQAGVVAWLLGDLAAGAKRTVVVEINAPGPGELCHQAEALADGGIRDRAELCTVFQGISALLLEMVDRDDPLDLAAATSYPILIRNTGSAPATNLRLKAIVPEGLQVTRATGPSDNRMGAKTPRGQELLFEVLPALQPDAEARYEVFVKGAKAGDLRFHVEMEADQLTAGPVRESESTRVLPGDDPGIPIRNLSLPTPYRP